MKQVFDFLGLPKYLKFEYPKYNAGSYSPIKEDIKKTLNNVFRPHNLKLEEYLNIDLQWN